MGPLATMPKVVINVASEVMRVSIMVAILRSLVDTFGVGADVVVPREQTDRPSPGWPDGPPGTAGLGCATDRSGVSGACAAGRRGMAWAGFAGTGSATPRVGRVTRRPFASPIVGSTTGKM